jgi:hypothetical protein
VSPGELLELIKRHAVMHASCVGLTAAGADTPARNHHAEEERLWAQIDAEVRRLHAEALHYDEETLFKAFAGLLTSGLTADQGRDAINQMQNQGILFRERPRA